MPILNFEFKARTTVLDNLEKKLLELNPIYIGEDVVHLDDFLEQKVNIDFYFFDTEKIIDLVTGTGFEIIDVVERQPYKDVEYPSKRAYVWVKKP